MTWTPAADLLSGLDGYAFEFNNAVTGSCDESKDLEEIATSASSGPLAAARVWAGGGAPQSNLATAALNRGWSRMGSRSESFSIHSREAYPAASDRSKYSIASAVPPALHCRHARL